MKKFVVIMCIRDDWDEPNVDIVEAKDENDAWDKAIEKMGFSEEEIDQGCEEGQIAIIIREVK